MAGSAIIGRGHAPRITWRLLAVGALVATTSAAASIVWHSRLLAVIDLVAVVLGVTAAGITLRAWTRQAGALAASESRYRALTDENPDAIVVECEDGIAFANAAAALLFGAPSSEALLGRSLNDFLLPEERKAGRARMERVWRGESVSPRVFRFHDAAGRAMVLEGRAVPVDFDGGRAVQVVLRDTRERHAAERALAESEDRYRLLTEASSDVIIRQDADYRCTYVSPRALDVLGLRAEELVGRDIADFMHPDDAARIRRRRAQGAAARASHSQPYAYRFVRPSGEVVWLEGNSARQFDADGALRGAVVVVRDISARRAMEERVRQGAKLEAVAKLAGGVAHGVNNMLTVISASAEFIREGGDGGRQVGGDLDAIVAATERGHQISRQLLAFSRRTVEQAALWPADALLVETATVLRRQHAAGHTLEVEGGALGAGVRVDRADLELALGNLVRNAWDAMPAGGVARLTSDTVVATAADAERAPDLEARAYVRFHVDDQGHGLSREAQEHLFEPFFTTKHEGSGAGLGLATVYGVVRRAGGAVTWESTPGEGTRFTLWLPSEALPVVHVVPASTEESGDPGRATVLVVDDEATVRRVAARAIERAGFRVLTASSGEEAVALLAACNGESVGDAEGDPIAVIVSDFEMPGMTGMELITHAQALYPAVRAVLMSGYTDDEGTRRRLQASATRFIEKPFTLDGLAEAVAEAAAGALIAR